jgi:hypothetical protein
MPILTAGPSGVIDLAGRLLADLENGQARPKQSIGAKDVPLGWATGLPRTVASFVASATVDGLSYGATTITGTGTPAKKVAAKGAKPTVVTVAQTTQTLDKYAGMALLTVEDQVRTEGLIAALATVITRQCLLAFDADVLADLAAAGGPTATGPTWAAAIPAAIGILAGTGHAPGLLVLSGEDYAAAVGAPGAGYALDPTQAVVTLFGVPIVISPSAVAGTGYLIDPASVLVTEYAEGPLAILDPYSMADTNEVRLIVDWFAASVVADPSGVVAITVVAAP